MNELAEGIRGLTWLEDQVRREIDIFRHNYQPWIPLPTSANGQYIHDVVIVGGGQYGLGLAWGLMRSKVENILVVDRSPAVYEGPWMTFARMKTLRTAKELTGIEFGVPSLSARAYWEARFGSASWQALSFVPRREWMEYLEWFRAVLEIPVSNDTDVVSIDGDADLARVVTRCNGEERTLLARRVILATGLLGSGGPNIPADLVEHLPPDRWAHATHDIDFARLRGGDVGVLGAGASAFDNAITAAENGASVARLFCRRAELPWFSVKKGLENAGFMRHFADFPDLYRWRFAKSILEAPIPPPRHTVEWALKLPNFSLELGSPWTASRMDGDKVAVVTPQGEHRFDFLIFGTGFDMDIGRRPEMASIAPHMRLWRDCFVPPDGEGSDMLLSQPYLGQAGEFQERTPGSCPVLERISLLGSAATLSIGPMFGGFNGLRFVLERFVNETCRALMLESLDTFYDTFTARFREERPDNGLGSLD